MKLKLYLALLALVVIVFTFQTRSSLDTVIFMRGDTVRTILPVAFEPYSLTVKATQPAAEAAGLRPGDKIVGINGKEIKGLHDYLAITDQARPGDRADLTIVRSPEQLPQTININFIARPKYNGGWTGWLINVALLVVMPFFCILLGFWAAFVRPKDPLAWLLLGLMLCFSQLVGDRAGYRGIMLDAAVIYKDFFGVAWPAAMLLFGIYFPDRIDWDVRRPWIKWLLMLPLVADFIISVGIDLGELHSYVFESALRRATSPFNGLLGFFALLPVSFFFIGISQKVYSTVAPDARRRLRLLLIGTMVALTPIFLLVMRRLILQKDAIERDVPFWLFLTALMLTLLFPLTLAYVIVVQRAMDVRMVIRQGVQYALAKSGVRVMQFALSAIAIFAAAALISNAGSHPVAQILMVSIGIATVFLLGTLSERIRKFIDRRFFRESYDAEVILSDLGEKVRSMVETGPLLETVARRIAESLHVQHVTFLLNRGGAYQPAFAVGYDSMPIVEFPEAAGTVTRLKREREPVVVYADDPDSWIHSSRDMVEERMMLARLDTQLLLPLSVKEKLPGFISLGPKQSEEPYSNTDLRLLQSVATQTGLALENSQLTATIANEVAQRERLNREVEIAQEVQERLFPQQLPPIEGLDYNGACRPALGVGGDYYDFLLLPNGKFGVAIGDVSGKGISAALLMASLQASLRGQAIQGTNDLATLMGHVNRLVFDASADNRYATFFYGQYDPSTRVLIYVNGGHNPPMIFRRAGGEEKLLRLETGGPVVGLLPDFRYTQGEISLLPGDLWVGFTDGISESMNEAEEEWGEDSMRDFIKGCYGKSAAEVLALCIEAADDFAAGAKQHDDMTMIVVRVI
ncbi:MAG: SpoIIE family protein phosphatase [Pyrinomonadaceae bacterium]